MIKMQNLELTQYHLYYIPQIKDMDKVSKYVQDLYYDNYNTLMNKIKKN